MIQIIPPIPIAIELKLEMVDKIIHVIKTTIIDANAIPRMQFIVFLMAIL